MKKLCAILLAAVLMIFTVVPAFAAISPQPDIEFDVIISNTEGGKGSYTTEIVENKKYVTLIAQVKDGYKFSHWIIEGDYTIIEGTLNDPELIVQIDSDIVATPHYTKEDGKTDSSIDQDHSSTSPQTGDFGYYYVFLIAGLFVSMIAAVSVKLAVSKK